MKKELKVININEELRNILSVEIDIENKTASILHTKAIPYQKLKDGSILYKLNVVDIFEKEFSTLGDLVLPIKKYDYEILNDYCLLDLRGHGLALYDKLKEYTYDFENKLIYLPWDDIASHIIVETDNDENEHLFKSLNNIFAIKNTTQDRNNKFLKLKEDIKNNEILFENKDCHKQILIDLDDIKIVKKDNSNIEIKYISLSLINLMNTLSFIDDIYSIENNHNINVEFFNGVDNELN